MIQDHNDSKTDRCTAINRRHAETATEDSKNSIFLDNSRVTEEAQIELSSDSVSRNSTDYRLSDPDTEPRCDSLVRPFLSSLRRSVLAQNIPFAP